MMFHNNKANPGRLTLIREITFMPLHTVSICLVCFRVCVRVKETENESEGEANTGRDDEKARWRESE